jgi:phage protein D
MPDPQNQGFRAARPTFLVAGQEQSALADGLLDLQICESSEGLYRCEAGFGNWGPVGGTTGFLYFDRQLLDFGKGFQVKLGDDLVFDGRIMALEARFMDQSPPALVVLAEDRFQDLRMTRRTVSYADLSDADVIRQIAQHHGLQADVDLDGPTHKVLAQLNQSDLAFVRERCRSLDADLWVEGSTLHAKARAARGGTPVELGMGNELLDFRVAADLAGQRTAVTVSGWDVGGKSAISHEATDGVLGSELGGLTSGASILSSALGDRKEALVHTVPSSTAEAQSRAEAYFKLAARQFVVGRGVAQGDARLKVGTRTDLKGLGPLFSGKYILTEVRHLFEGQRGLRTEFVAERPGLGNP